MKMIKKKPSSFLFFISLYLMLCLLITLKAEGSNQFEALRIKLADWVEEIQTDMPIKSSRYAKNWIIDQWADQQEDNKILSVRSAKEFKKAHLPHALNVTHKEILSGRYLDDFDSMVTFLIYSDDGYEAVSTMVLMNLLDHKTYILKFGMMDWNLQHVYGEVWKNSHSYPVSHEKEVTGEVFKLPVIKQTSSSLEELIKSRYTSYILRKDNTILIKDITDILQNWSENKSHYQIISVRRNKDYKTGHIANAINIPLFDLLSNEQLRRIDPDKTTLVYCDTGHLSELATTLLNLLGYNAQSIHYGMMGWNDKYISRQVAWDGSANYPVTIGDSVGY